MLVTKAQSVTCFDWTSSSQCLLWGKRKGSHASSTGLQEGYLLLDEKCWKIIKKIEIMFSTIIGFCQGGFIRVFVNMIEFKS
jgi:hypothetical protein